MGGNLFYLSTIINCAKVRFLNLLNTYKHIFKIIKSIKIKYKLTLLKLHFN